jgi:hypothetical protein
MARHDKPQAGVVRLGLALLSSHSNECFRFKLLLRPGNTATAIGIPRPKLPASKSIVDVYADFYRYLFDCSREFIKQSHAGLGDLVWDSLEDNIEFVLSHPNGWDGAQQAVMRRSVIKAGLVSDNSDGHERVTFVTEGEASMHFCIDSGLVCDEIKVRIFDLKSVW